MLHAKHLNSISQWISFSWIANMFTKYKGDTSLWQSNLVAPKPKKLQAYPFQQKRNLDFFNSFWSKCSTKGLAEKKMIPHIHYLCDYLIVQESSQPSKCQDSIFIKTCNSVNSTDRHKLTWSQHQQIVITCTLLIYSRWTCKLHTKVAYLSISTYRPSIDFTQGQGACCYSMCSTMKMTEIYGVTVNY